MSSQSSQASSKPESMKSLSEQVLQWQKELEHWNQEASNTNTDSKKSPTNATSGTREVPKILQDSEIQDTINALVKVLTSSLPKASEPTKTFKDTTLVNASLDVLTKVAMQQTAKTLFVSTGALKPISELLRKACLSQKFVVSNSPANATSSGQHNNFESLAAAAAASLPCDEKKDDDGTSCSPSISATSASSSSSSSEEFRKTPVMALHCLANLSDNASDAIKNDYLLPIANPLIHNIMEHSLLEKAIQRYACKFLFHLSNPLLQELVAAGFVEVLWKANQAHPDDAELQHYSNACLYNLLPVCPQPLLQQTVRPQQMVQGLVTGMTSNPTALEVQKYGLLVMTRVATHNMSQNPQIATSNRESPTNNNNNNNQNFNSSSTKDNALQASHALGLPHVIYCILTALNLHCKNDEIAQVGCNLLKHVSRISIDFANAMIDEGGLGVLVRIMQCHLDHTSIQDPVMATLRNLLSLRTTAAIGIVDTTMPEQAAKSIRRALNADYNKTESTAKAMIRVIGLVMSIHVPDAPIQAYGCDAFGRLAALDDFAAPEENQQWIRELLYEGNALRLALQAMRVHVNHVGVQDRAIVLLLRLCSYEPAYAFLRQEKEMEEESDAEDDDDGEEDYEYGDEYEDDSIGPVLTESASGDSNLSSELPQSFVYKILIKTKVSPKKESQDRLQRMLSIVDLQGLTPPSNSKDNDSSRGGDGNGLFSRLSMEVASERMRNLRTSFSSPTANVAPTSEPKRQRASWASPLKERTSRWWQSPPPAEGK